MRGSAPTRRTDPGIGEPERCSVQHRQIPFTPVHAHRLNPAAIRQNAGPANMHVPMEQKFRVHRLPHRGDATSPLCRVGQRPRRPTLSVSDQLKLHRQNARTVHCIVRDHQIRRASNNSFSDLFVGCRFFRPPVDTGPRALEVHRRRATEGQRLISPPADGEPEPPGQNPDDFGDTDRAPTVGREERGERPQSSWFPGVTSMRSIPDCSAHSSTCERKSSHSPKSPT